MITYYDVMKPVPFKAFSALFPDLHLLDLKEDQRLASLLLPQMYRCSHRAQAGGSREQET